MLVETGSLQDGEQIESEVTIVGAGAAGIVIAIELAKAGMDVVLVESGDKGPSPDIQALADAHDLGKNYHPPIDECTRLQLGGASVIWGGRCIPFDPIDFAKREYIPHSEWPVQYSELAQYFEAVCGYLRCGEAEFDIRNIPGISQISIVPGLNDGGVLTSRIERWSVIDFGKEYARELAESPHIRLLCGVSCTEIECSGNSGAVSSICGKTLSGKSIKLASKKYVLTAGGLNTTRLLLNSDRVHPGGIGNHSGLLGRFYTGHISGRIAKVAFSTDPKKTAYGFGRDKDGVYLRQRFSFDSETLNRHKIGNIVGWLVNPQLSDPSHGNGVLSFAYLVLSSPFGRFLVSEAIRKAAVTGAKGSSIHHIRNMFCDLPRTLHFMGSFGYGRYLAKPRTPGFFQYSKANQYDLHYFGEQTPNPDSRVSITDHRDKLGMRRIHIEHRYLQQDIDNVIEAHKLWDAHLRQQGCGALEYLDGDLPSTIGENANDGFHQIGTTRMSDKPEEGVVDKHGKVHHIDNLYIASSSTFVTASQANSMFTILAFAARLSRHLAGESKSDSTSMS